RPRRSGARACRTCCSAATPARSRAGAARCRCARRARAAPICSRARRSTTRTAPSSAGSGGAMADLYLALLHHPVYDKNGAVVTTAVTNMDVHDLGRLARTYDVRAFYVATPVPTLRRLVERIMRHWDTGPGATYNHTRKEALALARLAHDLDAVVADIEREQGVMPRLVATSAREGGRRLSFADLRGRLREESRPEL